MQQFETLLTETTGNIITVTINRPDKLNALNKQCMHELDALFTAIEEDDSIRCVIITGAGPKAFVAGADIGELHNLTPEEAKSVSEFGQSVFNKIELLSKPVIAAINGFALGGGAELAWSCHMRIAAENARFGQPEINLGLIPGYAGTQRLARMLPRTKTYELLLTGDAFDAATALNYGLVSKITKAEELMPAAVELAAKLVQKPGKVVSLLLKALQSAPETFQMDGQSLEASLFSSCFFTEDFKEGTSAFLEKRKPIFKHR